MVGPRIVMPAIGVPIDAGVISEIVIEVGLTGNDNSYIDRIELASPAIEYRPPRLKVDQFSQRWHAAIVKVGSTGERRLERFGDKSPFRLRKRTDVSHRGLQRMTGRKKCIDEGPHIRIVAEAYSSRIRAYLRDRNHLTLTAAGGPVVALRPAMAAAAILHVGVASALAPHLVRCMRIG